MPATDQMQHVLDQLASLGMVPIPTLSAENARQLPTPADAVMEFIAHHAGARAKGLTSPLPQPVGHISHRVIPGPGGDLLLRIYMPQDDYEDADEHDGRDTTPTAAPTPGMLAGAGGTLLPVTLYFHGGGWVIANLDSYDASCRALCNAAGCVLCSLAYRQAPEHKYPAAAEDAFAAYQWLLAHAADLNGDPRRIAVAGESAGGNLATVVCLMARDKGVPLPVYQVLIYPVCDTNTDTPSYQEQAHAKPLDKDMMVWFFKQYLPSADQGKEPYASPLRERNLAGLPAATIIAAELDPLRSEGEVYARRLREAGVPVEYSLFRGVTHEFFGMGAVLPEAQQALSDAAEGLRMGFSGRAQVRMQQARTARHPDAAVASPQAETALPPANTPPVSMPTATRGTPNTPASDRPNAPVTPGTAGMLGAAGLGTAAPGSPAEVDRTQSARIASPETGSTVDTGAHSTLPPAIPAQQVGVTGAGAAGAAGAADMAGATGSGATAPASPTGSANAIGAGDTPGAQQPARRTRKHANRNRPTDASLPARPAGVRIGMPVIGRGGDRVGTVKDVRAGDILVDRPMHRDIYVPSDAATADGDTLRLNISADQVDTMNWEQPPLM